MYMYRKQHLSDEQSMDPSMAYTLVPKTIGTVFGWDDWYLLYLSLIHNCISGYRYSPPGMIDLIRDTTNRHSTRTNYHNAISIPNFKLNTLAKSPLVSSSVAYNLLPSNLISLNKIQFKKAVSNESIISSILSKTSTLRSKIVFKLDM